MGRAGLKFLTISLFLVACNIEVGNPDGESPTSKASGISFNLSASSACENTVSPCAKLPVSFDGEQAATMSFDLTGTSFTLAEMQLFPAPRSEINRSLNILAGDVVPLNQNIDLSAIARSELYFQPASAAGIAFSLTGKIRIADAPGAEIPLTVNYASPLLIQNSVAADGTVLTGFVFDADTWFDFRGKGLNADHLSKKITSGPCADPASNSCDQQKRVIAEKIAANIAQSVKVKKTPKGQQGKPN